MHKPEPPGTYVFTGIVATGFAVGMWLFAATLYTAWPIYALAAVTAVGGWVAMMAGTIAIGIRIGARWVDYERQRTT